MIRIDGVSNGGEEGQFRANADSIGWKSYNGRVLVHQAACVKRAEWFEGKLRVLLVDEEAPHGQQEQVLALEGFPPTRFDDIWRYFEESCGVYVKKHRPIATLAEDDYDQAMRMIEDAADRVDEVPAGSVQKKAREADLMVKIEAVRDGLDQAVGGDKQALSRVFAANGCERIGRLRLVVDTVQVEVYQKDPRWLHLQNKAATIEAVLRELGTYREWRPSEDQEHASLARRQMVAELRRRQDGENTDASPEPSYAGDAVGTDAKNPNSGYKLGENAVSATATEAPISDDGYPTTTPTPTPPPTIADVAGPLPHRPLISGDEGGDDYVRDGCPHASTLKGGAHQNEASTDAARRLRYMRSDSVLEGWVWKRSRFLKRWRRRWFVLMPRHLISFKDRGAPEATERISQGEVVRVYSADHELNQARSFCIVAGNRNYYVVCDDEAQKRDWMREITKALGTRYG